MTWCVRALGLQEVTSSRDDECVFREDTIVLLEMTTRDMMEVTVTTVPPPCSRGLHMLSLTIFARSMCTRRQAVHRIRPPPDSHFHPPPLCLCGSAAACGSLHSPPSILFRITTTLGIP